MFAGLADASLNLHIADSWGSALPWLLYSEYAQVHAANLVDGRPYHSGSRVSAGMALQVSHQGVNRVFVTSGYDGLALAGQLEHSHLQASGLEQVHSWAALGVSADENDLPVEYLGYLQQSSAFQANLNGIMPKANPNVRLTWHRKRYLISGSEMSTRTVTTSVYTILVALVANGKPSSFRVEVGNDAGPIPSSWQRAREWASALAAAPEPWPERPKRMSVLLGHEAAAILFHEAIGHALECEGFGAIGADVAHPIGQRIAPSSISVTANDLGFCGDPDGVVDSEGTPVRPTVLVDSGVVTAHLTNAASSSAFQLPSTGNGIRSDYRSAPLTRMISLRVSPGGHSLAQLVGGIGDGLFVETIRTGGYDRMSGRIRLECELSYRLVEGKHAGRQSDLLFEGDAGALLSKIEALGDESHWCARLDACGKDGQNVYVRHCAPSVLLRDVAVVGA